MNIDVWLILVSAFIFLALPSIVGGIITTTVRGWARIAILLILFALPAWALYSDHDCNAHSQGSTDGPCDIADLYAFWGMISGFLTMVAIAIGTIYNFFRRRKAETL